MVEELEMPRRGSRKVEVLLGVSMFSGLHAGEFAGTR